MQQPIFFFSFYGHNRTPNVLFLMIPSNVNQIYYFKVEKLRSTKATDECSISNMRILKLF